MSEQKGYDLPEYDLKVNALELGFLRGIIGDKGMERIEKEMPSLYKKIKEIVDSFYK